MVHSGQEERDWETPQLVFETYYDAHSPSAFSLFFPKRPKFQITIGLRCIPIWISAIFMTLIKIRFWSSRPWIKKKFLIHLLSLIWCSLEIFLARALYHVAFFKAMCTSEVTALTRTFTVNRSFHFYIPNELYAFTFLALKWMTAVAQLPLLRHHRLRQQLLQWFSILRFTTPPVKL